MKSVWMALICALLFTPLAGIAEQAQSYDDTVASSQNDIGLPSWKSTPSQEHVIKGQFGSPDIKGEAAYLLKNDITYQCETTCKGYSDYYNGDRLIKRQIEDDLGSDQRERYQNCGKNGAFEPCKKAFTSNLWKPLELRAALESLLQNCNSHGFYKISIAGTKCEEVMTKQVCSEPAREEDLNKPHGKHPNFKSVPVGLRCKDHVVVRRPLKNDFIHKGLEKVFGADRLVP